MNVLIVEDHPDLAQLIARWVRDAGHAAETCYSAFDALKTAPTFRPDLVLLDIGLPEMDGWELAQELRRNRALQHARLVVISAFQSDEDRDYSKRLGIDAHLPKPVDRRAVLAVLETCVGHPP